ncbi:hypothetical protein VTO42DRAFT_4289 [Malbranchea cinnamomea]
MTDPASFPRKILPRMWQPTLISFKGDPGCIKCRHGQVLLQNPTLPTAYRHFRMDIIWHTSGYRPTP